MIKPTDEMVAVFAGTGIWADEDEVRTGLAAILALVERDCVAELADLRALFDLQWTRSREADAMWQAEDPENRANTWPDLGALLAWLMAKIRTLEAAPPAEHCRCECHQGGTP